jgi:hypothetical protein
MSMKTRCPVRREGLRVSDCFCVFIYGTEHMGKQRRVKLTCAKEYGESSSLAHKPRTEEREGRVARDKV